MSLINEYRSTEEAIKELQERLNKLKGDEGLQKEIEFEKKLRELMGVYNKSLKDVIAIIDPQAVRGTAAKTTGTKKPRKVKTYKNPNTGEVIETKGGNHKVLKEWKAQWGSDVVESWATV
jgi:hypothetical protein